MTRSRAATILAIVFGILAVAGPAIAAGDWRDKVDPWVLETAQWGPTEFLVYLADQADLSGTEALQTKQAKNEAVFEALTATASRSQAPLLASLDLASVEHRAYWIANMVWVRGDLSVVEAMAKRDDVAHVYANPAVRMDEPVARPDEGAVKGDDSPDAVEWNIAHVNAPAVWALGDTGQGVVVAGQDTGYLWTHPALVGKYRGSAGHHDYSWWDAIHSGGGSCGPDSPEPCDDHGHGTHTMGTMVGDDGGSNQVGMAPGAQWIGCRNMDQGVGTPATYAECYQFFLAPTDLAGNNPDPAMAPDVINNSWGCPPSEGCTDPNVLLTVVQNVRAAGIVTVHSAGNDGSSCSTVSDPAAIYDESFSVGATSSSDAIASFSSRGPVTVDGSNRRKPDISAPGVDIRSSTRDGGYQGGWQGTSMAGPHVAGLVALVIAGHPDLAGNVDAIEEGIEQSAVHLTSTQGCGGDPGDAVPNNVFGWGRIDALAAYQHIYAYSVTASPAAVGVCAPDDAVLDVVLDPASGFSDSVDLAVTGLPSGLSADLQPVTVTPPGTSVLTISGTGGVSPGISTVTVTGTSSPGGTVRSDTFELGIFDAAPAAATLTSPAAGATNVSERPTFDWIPAAQAETFHLEVATDAGFADLVIDESGLREPTFTPSSDLATNSRFWWRVWTSNACGDGPVSASASFVTAALPGDCGLGSTPVEVFFDDLDGGPSGWTTGGSGSTWQLSSARTHSGTSAYFGQDSGSISDQLLTTGDIALPAGLDALTLQLWSWQELESTSTGCYDGGVVEVSTDGGGSWTQLTPDAATDPYDGPVSSSFSNPLGGLNAWCGDPQDWTRAVVDVAAYGGQTARFRFRLGTDSGVSREGWYVDDIAVRGCAAANLEIFSDGFEAGDAAAWSDLIQ